MSKSIFALIAFFWANFGHGVDLTQYPYPSDPSPVDLSELSPADRGLAKKLPTEYVRFLFVSPCDPAGLGAEACLWAYVTPLSKSRVALEPHSDRSVSIYTVKEKDEGPYDFKAGHQFVSVLRLPNGAPPNLDVNGRSSLVTHWVTLVGSDGAEQGLPVPMVWLPVTATNQVRVNNEYYEALRTSPGREVKFLYGDLQAGPIVEGEAFFVVLGYGMADPRNEAHYFVARKHPYEPDAFTALLKRGAVRDGIPEEFDWMGYTFSMHEGEPVAFESLSLMEPEKPKASKRARITAQR
jgi:hypothetical protein